ncbi:unnamed protein product [Thlaspi arvense]|uniref:Exostosin GT47 domain-containing protein n=1 Tax=Thlaspi arvense TaxID=13288 RepID=A0AAU9RUG2_THLAR|nr:unnamed protein product [Thlaspi arvense]
MSVTRILRRVHVTDLLFFLVCLWSTSTIISIYNVFYTCISSPKLNHLYCLTAGSHQPGSWDLETGEERYRYINSKGEGEVTAPNDVDKYLQIQRSWLSMRNNRQNPGSCEGKGVYVYDLPSKFNKDLLGECSDMVPWVNLCSFFKNDAFGESIESLGKGWFRTHQYSLEPIFHARVLKHPCRVYDESQAKLFFVPYYGGIDVLRWHFKNVSKDVKDALAIDVVDWLGSKKSWRRNSGKDHVFVLGKISWDFRRNGKSSWGSSLLEMQEMRNPTKLLIERNPWDVNDVAIPHPTFFHPKNDDDISSWQNKIIVKPRRSLISFAGAARPGNPDSIRSILIDQCISSPNHCRFLNCTDGGCDKPVGYRAFPRFGVLSSTTWRQSNEEVGFRFPRIGLYSGDL